MPRVSRKVLCIDSGQTFDDVHAAAASVKVSKSTLGGALAPGGRGIAGGKRWKWADGGGSGEAGKEQPAGRPRKARSQAEPARAEESLLPVHSPALRIPPSPAPLTASTLHSALAAIAGMGLGMGGVTLTDVVVEAVGGGTLRIGKLEVHARA